MTTEFPVFSAALNGKNGWLFCTVIDNFGDIGVSWRLAQMLHNELGCNITLWLDDEAALRRLCPNLPPLPCTYQNTELRLWQEGVSADLNGAPPPDLVIETFACTLPETVHEIIRRKQPLWLNWEYLSAEDWAEAMHGKPSLQADGRQKFFWLMGFTERSGGLLREHDYTVRIENTAALRRTLGLPEKTPSENERSGFLRSKNEQNEFLRSKNEQNAGLQEWLLFGYASPIWADWLAMWQTDGRPLCLLLAGGKIIESLKTSGCIPQEALQNDGDTFQSGCAELVRLPFVAQHDFDRLLAFSDGLIVRGEDSFVRAQLSGKPFLWHIYPQDEAAHLDKLDAFWCKTENTFPPELFAAHQALSAELNGGATLSAAERLAAWQTLQNRFSAWQNAAQTWQKQLFAQASAVEKLAKFADGLLK
ncbi:MAG: elongation factor P maturation arginine rhamnosyltransferase EarP [Neisseria sp.]|nr:elongation factor P maturation arginine rhamnosyltransferase EarP [Neisseria sp.]